MLIGSNGGGRDSNIWPEQEKIKINQTSTYMEDESETKDSGIVRAGHDIYKQITGDNLTATVRFAILEKYCKGILLTNTVSEQTVVLRNDNCWFWLYYACYLMGLLDPLIDWNLDRADGKLISVIPVKWFSIDGTELTAAVVLVSIVCTGTPRYIQVDCGLDR